jgi:hypothetical protein
VGEGFAAFIAGHDVSRSVPHLAELAAVEYAVSETLDAPDDAPLCPEDVASLSPEALTERTFCLRHSARLLACHWNVPKLREQLPNLARFQQSDDRLDAFAGLVLVWRPDLGVRLDRLTGSQAQVLEALAAGTTFGEVVDAMARTDRAEPALVANWMMQWLQARVFQKT